MTHRLHMPSFSQTQWTWCKRQSLKWAARTGTQPCIVFAAKISVDLPPQSVTSNKQADRPASTAHITSGLQVGREEVLRGFRNFLNMDRPEHHSTDRLKERVEKGSCPHSILQGQKQSVFNQIMALFGGQPWGDCWETGRSLYWPLQALWRHLEQKLKGKLKLNFLWVPVFDWERNPLLMTIMRQRHRLSYAYYDW